MTLREALMIERTLHAALKIESLLALSRHATLVRFIEQILFVHRVQLS
jgi:hypothetical protein